MNGVLSESDMTGYMENLIVLFYELQKTASI